MVKANAAAQIHNIKDSRKQITNCDEEQQPIYQEKKIYEVIFETRSFRTEKYVCNNLKEIFEDDRNCSGIHHHSDKIDSIVSIHLIGVEDD
jgi:hypothetical protein